MPWLHCWPLLSCGRRIRLRLTPGHGELSVFAVLLDKVSSAFGILEHPAGVNFRSSFWSVSETLFLPFHPPVA